jgi:hypothetical protein
MSAGFTFQSDNTSLLLVMVEDQHFGEIGVRKHIQVSEFAFPRFEKLERRGHMKAPLGDQEGSSAAWA